MLAGAVALLHTLTPVTAAGAEVATEPAKANNGFAFALLGQTAGGGENFALSPVSVWSALAMTSAGAEKETLTGMRQTLGLPADESAHAIVGQWVKSLRETAPVEIRVANRLWGEKAFSFRESFLKTTEQHYMAGLEELDFSGAPGPSRLRINAWVAEQTRDRIKDLLDADQIKKSTKLVLTNAVYFKGDWASPFHARSTSAASFTQASGNAIQVKMMRASHTGLAYMENRKLQAIRLPYTGGTTSMIVVLPRKADVLHESFTFLDAKGFASVLSELKPARRVAVQLPRFEVSARRELNKPLSALGMARAFTDDAEFGGMCADPLKISTVVHQAWVKVAEKGTEAAAATAVVMVPTGAAPNPEPTKLFTADRPFLFFIMDNRNDGILFAGKVMRPELAE